MTRLSAEHFDRLPLTCGNEKLTRLPFSPPTPFRTPSDRDSRQQLKDNRQPIHVIHLTELRPHKIHLTAALEPFQQPNQICPEASHSQSQSQSQSLSQSGLGWATFYGHGRQLRSRLTRRREGAETCGKWRNDCFLWPHKIRYKSFCRRLSRSLSHSVILCSFHSLSLFWLSFLSCSHASVGFMGHIYEMYATQAPNSPAKRSIKVCQLDKWIII